MSRASLLLVLLGACGRLGFDSQPTDLIVSVSEDRMAGPGTMSSLAELVPGTPGLSLREALTIAKNRAGPDRIAFAPEVFGRDPAIAIDKALELGGAGTVIDGSTVAVTLMGKAGYTGTLLSVTGDGAVIDGLGFRGGGTAIEAIAVNGTAIRNIAIDGTSGVAIHLEVCVQPTIEDVQIDRAGGDPMLVRGTFEATIQRNFISLLTKSGSVHGINLDSVTRSHVLDNVVDPGDAYLISLTDSSDNEVIGNILDRGDTGITIFGASQRNLVFRNVVISPAVDSVYLDASVTDTTIVNNTFFMAPDIADNGVTTKAANNLLSTRAADFIGPVGPPSYDFRLAAGMAAAIDAAADLGQDMLPDQMERFLGKGPDLGAVESY